jgi:ribosome-binding factor A
MSREFSRTRRVGEQIQKELAQIVQLEMKDPRLKWVTISNVDVSKDLAHATVYYTLLDPNSDRQAVEKVINRAHGFLRKELGRRMRLRIVPELHFKYDVTMEYGSKLSALIDAAVDADKKNDNDS